MEDFPVPGLLEINVFVYFGGRCHTRWDAVIVQSPSEARYITVIPNLGYLPIWSYLGITMTYISYILHRLYTLLIGSKHACYIPRYHWPLFLFPFYIPGSSEATRLVVASEVICLVVYNNGYNTNNGYNILIVVIIYQYNNSGIGII
jgi:hypothetical protein